MALDINHLTIAQLDTLTIAQLDAMLVDQDQVADSPTPVSPPSSSGGGDIPPLRRFKAPAKRRRMLSLTPDKLKKWF